MNRLAISTERKGGTHTALLAYLCVSNFSEEVMNKKYLGKICLKHPELNGLRQTSDSRCCRCEVIRSAKRKQKRKEANGVYCFGKICVAHPELNGQRLSSNGDCIGCQKDRKEQRQLKNGILYFGAVCSNHLHLDGKRYSKSGDCVYCKNEEPKITKIKNGTRFLGRVCEHHPELNGLRLYSNNDCIKCNSEKRAARISKKLASDPIYRLKYRIRSTINNALKNKGFAKKSKSTLILGCDWSEFAKHIESQFTEGMSWDNRHLWHLDHIEPISRAISEDDIYRLNHYTNFQPLWAEDNIAKSNKYKDNCLSGCLPIEGSRALLPVNPSPIHTLPSPNNGLF
jgi:hypothetical protein